MNYPIMTSTCPFSAYLDTNSNRSSLKKTKTKQNKTKQQQQQQQQNKQTNKK